MNLSLMRIDSIFLLSLNINANPNWIPKEGDARQTEEVEPEFDFTVYKHTQGLRFSVRLKVKSTWQQVPESPFLSIESDILGIYSFPEGISEDQIREYVPTLCLVNLYSLARGIIAQATGMCPSGTIYLPLVNMNEVVKQHAQRMEQVHLQGGIFTEDAKDKPAERKRKGVRQAKSDK